MKGWADNDGPHVFYGGGDSALIASEYTDEDDNVMNNISMNMSENRERERNDANDDDDNDGGGDDDNDCGGDNNDVEYEDERNKNNIHDNIRDDENDEDVVIDEHIDHWLTANNDSTPMKNAARHVSCKL
jgi:hypothetical protein